MLSSIWDIQPSISDTTEPWKFKGGKSFYGILKIRLVQTDGLGNIISHQFLDKNNVTFFEVISDVDVRSLVSSFVYHDIGNETFPFVKNDGCCFVEILFNEYEKGLLYDSNGFGLREWFVINNFKILDRTQEKTIFQVNLLHRDILQLNLLNSYNSGVDEEENHKTYSNMIEEIYKKAGMNWTNSNCQALLNSKGFYCSFNGASTNDIIDDLIKLQTNIDSPSSCFIIYNFLTMNNYGDDSSYYIKTLNKLFSKLPVEFKLPFYTFTKSSDTENPSLENLIFDSGSDDVLKTPFHKFYLPDKQLNELDMLKAGAAEITNFIDLRDGFNNQLPRKYVKFNESTLTWDSDLFQNTNYENITSKISNKVFKNSFITRDSRFFETDKNEDILTLNKYDSDIPTTELNKHFYNHHLRFTSIGKLCRNVGDVIQIFVDSIESKMLKWAGFWVIKRIYYTYNNGQLYNTIEAVRNYDFSPEYIKQNSPKLV